MKNNFKSGITQNHTVLVFILLYHQKVALNGGFTIKDGLQTSNKPFHYWVSVLESVPSISAYVAIIKDVNGDLHSRLIVLCVAQGLFMLPNILNLLNAEVVAKTLPVATQIEIEFTGHNADKLMG